MKYIYRYINLKGPGSRRTGLTQLVKTNNRKSRCHMASDTELKNTDPDYSGHMICGNIPATVEAGTV